MLSQEDLGAIFYSSSNPYMVLLPDTPHFTIVDVNEAYLRITKTKRADLVNKKLFEAFPDTPDASYKYEKDKVKACFEEVIAKVREVSLPTIRYDIPLRDSDGFAKKFWLSVNYPVTDSDGKVKFIVHNPRDVTEKVLLEIKEREISTELTTNKEHYRSLFDYNPDGVYSFDLEGNFLSANPSIAAIAECSVEELMHKSFIPFIHPHDLDMTMAHFLRASTGEPQNYVTRAITSKGNPKVLNVTNLPIMVDEKIVGVYGIAKDITNQVRTDQQLILSNERYRYVSKATNSAIWDWDLQNKEIFWGNGFTNLFGYEKTEDESSWTDRIHHEDRERVLSGIHHIINSPRKSLWTDDYRFLKANSEYAFVTDRGFVIRDEFGQSVRMVGAMVDVTERKLIELERAKLLQDLIKQNVHLEQFNYIVSHNLRAPVANVRGLTDLLLKRDMEPEVIDEIIKDIDTSILSIDNIIKDLNNILASKNEARTTKDKIDFEEIVEDVILSIQSTISASKAVIKYDFKEIAYFKSIKSYIYSIFYNLISNSIKYSQPNKAPVIRIVSKIEEGKIVLSFTDNGLGFPASKTDKIFGLYKRLHSQIEGKGIGLFMVKSQIDSLDGSIYVESEVNKGTTFRIVLPI